MQANPWRYGFTDALFNRECKSPWGNAGWAKIRNNNQYLAGYMAGKETLKQQGKINEIRNY